MSDILNMLKGRDRQSIGKADKIERGMLDEPSLFAPLFESMMDEYHVIRIFLDYLEDESKMVQVNSLQALTDLTKMVRICYPRILDL